MATLHRDRLACLALLFSLVLAPSVPVRAAWLPWDRPIRRKIEAPTVEALSANLEKLRPDLPKDTYAHLINSLGWLAYYHGAKLRACGILNPELAMRNMLAQVHKKSAFDIIIMAEDLSEKETVIFAEYKLALKTGHI